MKKLLILPFFVLALVSCEEKKATTGTDSTATTTLPADSVLSAYTSLRDSTNKAWEIMIKSDDQKIADMKRLLQEISYCKSYNAMRLDSVSKAVDGLTAQRYQQATMTSEQIDAYDDQTSKIFNALRSLALSTKELSSHPIAETLYNDIAKAENDVVRYRSLYDKYAFQYNDFIAKYKDQLKDQGDLKPLPVFTIQQPA